ncbi:unnamed protein product [Blepharisma stoltei]|uniref:Uncharacterized protein n=1 Tax=Blepharisma stoltei TaxID=1481888 RepID=A0AAU9K7U6_9CILI|nr:unnamed protein product [Blepharisma stoltei]
MLFRRSLRFFNFRFFSEVQKAINPMKDLITQIENNINAVELMKKEREMSEVAQERKRALNDLEQTAAFKVHEFDNENLLKILKIYAENDQGTEKLLSAISSQIYRRIHSFSYQELSDIVFYLYNWEYESRVFDVIDNLLIKNPFEITPEMAARISLAYGMKKKGSDTLFKIITNIFLTKKAEINAENGIMIITGLYKKEYKDFALLRAIEEWAVSKAETMNPSQISQLFYCLIKLESPDSVLEKIENSFKIQDFQAKDIEKVLGCYLFKNRALPNGKLLDRCIELISKNQITPSELVQLIYTLSQHNNTADIFTEIEKLIVNSIESFTQEEIVYLFVALIRTGKETPSILSILKPCLDTNIDAKYLSMIYASILRRGNLYIETLEPLFKWTATCIKGNILDTQSIIAALYTLLHLKYQNLEFWSNILKCIKDIKIRSADEYIQIYKITQRIGKLDLDVGEVLEFLSRRYENPN